MSEPVFSDEEKEQWLAVFTDPAGITLHAFPDRDGTWRARVTCADGSRIYTPPFPTAYGAFNWFAETSMLFRMFHRPYLIKIFAAPASESVVEPMKKYTLTCEMGCGRTLEGLIPQGPGLHVDPMYAPEVRASGWRRFRDLATPTNHAVFCAACSLAIYRSGSLGRPWFPS